MEDSPTSLSLASLPTFFILTSRLGIEDVDEIEDKLAALHASVTYDIREAGLILGTTTKKARAAFELRAKGLWTEEIVTEATERPVKRRRLTPPRSSPPAGREADDVHDSSTESDGVGARSKASSPTVPSPKSCRSPPSSRPSSQRSEVPDRVKVLQLEWLWESDKAGRVLPFESYLVYDARPVERPESTLGQQYVHKQTGAPIKGFNESTPSSSQNAPPESIISRAQADASSSSKPNYNPTLPSRRTFNSRSTPLLSKRPHPKFVQQETTNSEENDDAPPLPDPPAWVQDNILYACLRKTPLNPPNARFVAALETIKLSRILTGDEIGVRAYSTSIASIRAYPYQLISPAEIVRLPGCESKIARLFSEYVATSPNDADRHLPTAAQLDADPTLQSLRLFYNIWGVGGDTARKFYHDNGWRDLDDVIENGWSALNRVQQIGLKFYDDFLLPIPRTEVEYIAGIVLSNAREVYGITPEEYGTGDDIVAVIVGGYRRGKDGSGDVDIILSHRDASITKNMVEKVLLPLEQSRHVTHTLTLQTTNSQRDQQTLPYRDKGQAGGGFDSLDKALVVWQDPDYSRDAERKGKNPNPHRRVDIIISPWRTVGCAILGWSGANTFERDIRRYVKRFKGWKFDSSGVRDRGRGMVVDLERPKEKSQGMEEWEWRDRWEDRERRVMEGLGIGWRPPTERCTG